MMADGSALADAHPTVTIDRQREPYRWLCPNGHSSWDRTNSHLWCPECRRSLEADSAMVIKQAEHWMLYDKKQDKTVPYSAVQFAEDQ